MVFLVLRNWLHNAVTGAWVRFETNCRVVRPWRCNSGLPHSAREYLRVYLAGWSPTRYTTMPMIRMPRTFVVLLVAATPPRPSSAQRHLSENGAPDVETRIGLSLEAVVTTGLVDPASGTRVPFTVGRVDAESAPVPAPNAIETIQGKIAGVTVIPSGQPAAARTSSSARRSGLAVRIARHQASSPFGHAEETGWPRDRRRSRRDLSRQQCAARPDPLGQHALLSTNASGQYVNAAGTVVMRVAFQSQWHRASRTRRIGIRHQAFDENATGLTRRSREACFVSR